jgi:non-homologous end joining protein Ku
VTAPHDDYATADAPKRGTASLTVMCGLVTIPVSIQTGMNSLPPGTLLPRQMWHRVVSKPLPPEGTCVLTGEDGEDPDDCETHDHEEVIEWHAVGSQSYDKVTGAVLESFQITYRAEATNGELVELTPENVEEALGGTSDDKIARVTSFVPMSTIGQEYVVLKWDQCHPAKRKATKGSQHDPAAAYSFELLRSVMEEFDVAALCELDKEGTGRYCLWTHDGRWLRVAPANVVRAIEPLPEVPELKPMEVDLARKLVTDVVGIATPAVSIQEAIDQVQAWVDAKAGGKPAPELPTHTIAPVVDLMASLQASIEQAEPKKPKAKKKKVS